MESDLDRALKLVRLRLQQEPGKFSDSFLLVIAMEQEDDGLQAKALAKINEWAKSEEDQDNTWSTRYAKMVQRILSVKTAAEIDFEAVDRLIRDESVQMGWCNTCYFLSKSFEARGFTELADRYRDWAISFNDPSRITWHLAGFDAAHNKKLAEAP